jgi:predicted transcriptional regulator
MRIRLAGKRDGRILGIRFVSFAPDCVTCLQNPFALTVVASNRGSQCSTRPSGERKGIRAKSRAFWRELVATSDPIQVAAEIVAAFVSHNSLPISDLPSLLESVHSAVNRASGSGEITDAVTTPPSPAVAIRKSITPDYLICLEDGQRFKSMRRHLALLGMTPEQYRAKWGLPPTYPMVAPNYAAQRSAMAKHIGLGQLRKKSGGTKSKTGTKAKRKVVSSPQSSG